MANNKLRENITNIYDRVFVLSVNRAPKYQQEKDTKKNKNYNMIENIIEIKI